MNRSLKTSKKFANTGCFFLLLLISACSSNNQNSEDQSIDRYSLVTRHNPVLTAPDKLSPITVGNGEFAFTADVTGLQTFPEFYSRNGDTNSTPPGPGSPPVRQLAFGQCLLNLLQRPFLVGVSMMCYLTPIFTASYSVRVPQYRLL